MKLFLKLFILLSCIQSYCQEEFENNVIIKREFQQRPEQVFSVDLDNDGDLDILVGEYDVIIWFENLDGQGTFSERILISGWDVGWCNDMDIGDIDNDGDMDIVYSSRNEDRIAVKKNVNNASFFPTSYPVYTNVSHVQLVDINNDDNLDLLYVNSSNIIWKPNINGDGEFGNPIVIASGVSNVLNIEHGDLDNDNYEDIIVTSEFGLKLFWYKNVDGIGNFSAAQAISSELNFPTGLFIADLDADGDEDVISGDYPGIYWSENNGNGDFEDISLISNDGIRCKDVYIDDIDNDGNLDLLKASNSGMYWYKNDGEENFSNQPALSELTTQSYRIITGDFDGNGTLDVATGSSSKTSWYKNIDGLGNFSPEINLYPAHWHPKKVQHADIDNDGDIDLIVVGRGLLAWYENIDDTGDYNQKTIFYGVGNSNDFGKNAIHLRGRFRH